jgi:hypothetical protein
MSKQYQSIFGNGNKGNGDQPTGSLRNRIPVPSSGHKTERPLYIPFGNTVLKEDSKTLKEYGFGRHSRALLIAIEPDDMNHTGQSRSSKNTPTLEAADNKKDDRASDLQTTHNPFRSTNAKDLYRRILLGAALHRRSLPAQVMPKHPCIFRDTFNRVWPIHLKRANSPTAHAAVLESSFRNLDMQPHKGQHPSSGILSVTQYADISRLWEAWFCPGRRQHMRKAFRKWEWEEVSVCLACQYDIEDFFRITPVQFDR